MTVARETATELDSAMDVLLEGRRGPVPATEGEQTATARLLRDVLLRFHPGFGLEELLAARLAAGRAVASGVSLAIRLAGAAFVEWRHSRSSGGLL